MAAISLLCDRPVVGSEIEVFMRTSSSPTIAADVVWLRSRAPPGAAAACARCGEAGIKVEAALLSSTPSLAPFAQFCSNDCMRASWHQLRDLQAWALAAQPARPKRSPSVEVKRGILH